ncbi:GT-D fold domain-containing glycosyltransferase [Paenibacillus glycanilyticus]|uniref:GT-D fold domain-containing protein n=1 Tax=Paenibacillus glycanilyticus TaxID=126569 RepID=UPI00204100A3|nr:GT-D fold domain-containing glycosyltransferase [Paenibacillus glycanilyticus]MCM3626013.1 GT-D fold domain-containing glycosyltransferase [Paenibacillus glycanilyticus]
MSIRAPRKRQNGKRQRKRKSPFIRKRHSRKAVPQSRLPKMEHQATPTEAAVDKEADGGQAAEASYQASYQAAYEKGYQEGKYAGGEEIIDQLLPPNLIFPDISLKQVIATGVSMYREQAVPLLIAEQVRDAILLAMNERKPLSIVRLGDGELLTLAQEVVMPVDAVRREGKFLEYAGVKVPDLDIRNRLAEAITRADIVGLPRTRMPNYQLLVAPVFQAYGISFKERQWTDSLINYSLCQAGCLLSILQNRRVLIIGNMAEPLSAVLAQHGILIAGIIAPVNGARDAARVVQLAKHYDFDIALVSAGIGAVLITEELARITGKVAIDFGHLANAIVKGEATIQ